MKLVFPRLLVAVLLVTLVVLPRTAAAFDVGFKAGACFANISGEIPELGSDFTIRNGFSGGVFLDLKLGERLSIQPEVIYMQKGAWLKDMPFTFVTPEEILIGEMDVEFRVWYFEIPILLKYTMRPNSFLRPFLCSGPVASYTQRAIVEITQNIGPYSWGVRDDIAGNLEKWDFGVAFGGGMHFAFGESFTVFLEGRYTLGLRELNKLEDDASVKNRAIAVLIGLNVSFSD